MLDAGDKGSKLCFAEIGITALDCHCGKAVEGLRPSCRRVSTVTEHSLSLKVVSERGGGLKLKKEL